MREGDRLNLTCNIKAGVPKPQVSWYKNEIRLTDEESPNLILEELADKDEGQYKCKAQNSVGVSVAIINVTVDGKSREVLAFVCLLTFMNVKIKQVFLEQYLFLLVVVDLGLKITSAFWDIQNSKN